MISVWLPWPDKVLSPNGRAHHMTRAKATKLARTLAWGRTLEALNGREPRLPDGPIPVKVTFVPSRKRRGYDHDNAEASIKSFRDGIADALRVNDTRFRTTYKHEPWNVPSGVLFEIGETV